MKSNDEKLKNTTNSSDVAISSGIWKMAVEKIDGTDGIDISDGINDVSEMDSLIKHISPELFDALDGSSFELFNVLKQTHNGQSLVMIDKLLEFLLAIDDDNNGQLSDDELIKLKDKNGKMNLDFLK